MKPKGHLASQKVPLGSVVPTTKPLQQEQQRVTASSFRGFRTRSPVLMFKAWPFLCLEELTKRSSVQLGLGAARLNSAQLGAARLGSARLDSARIGSARSGSTRLCSAGLGSAWLSLARLSVASLGSARLGSPRLRSLRLGSARLPSLGSAHLDCSSWLISASSGCSTFFWRKISDG